MEGLLIGVASAFTASFLIYIGRHFIGGLFSLIFFSRKIAGTWFTTFSKKDGKEYHEIAHISQLFSNVWGEIEFSQKHETRTYKVRGSFKEGVLVANYEIIHSKRVLDRGSFTLRLSNNGKTLTGCYSWTDDEATNPQGDTYVWNKQNK